MSGIKEKLNSVFTGTKDEDAAEPPAGSHGSVKSQERQEEGTIEKLEVRSKRYISC